MIFGILFAFWRFSQIVTLIPVVGMLSYFVDQYRSANALTPDSILVLFIVSVLAVVWAIGTLFTYHRSKTNSLFVSIIDLLFVGAFIGAVWCLRAITDADCAHWDRSRSYSADFGIVTVNGSILGVDINKQCAMLKASFAFGIMNCIFFFLTSLFALLVHNHYRSGDVVVKRETHYSRHGHRSRSPRHSHHSHRSRSYV